MEEVEYSIVVIKGRCGRKGVSIRYGYNGNTIYSSPNVFGSYDFNTHKIINKSDIKNIIIEDLNRNF